MGARRFVLVAIGLCAVLSVWLSPARIKAEPPGPAILQLTDDRAVDIRPAWSPDNRSIAYQSNRGSSTFHIYVMSAEGSDQRPLTQGSTDDRHPAWMPDGKEILFDSSDGTESEIWMVSAADGSRKQITHVGALASFASPSPDGQYLSFYVFQNETLDLWTARIDGSDAKPVTRNLASAENNQCTFACHPAAWHPDSRTIAYSAGELDTIWSVDSDGRNLRQVIANGGDNHFPWFMPDGRLGYITEHVNPAQSWTDAWIFDFKTGKSTILQERMSMQGPFEWSADNTKVLFYSPRSGNFEIYLVDLSVPGGSQALQGTPVPVQLAAGNATRAGPPVNSTADGQASLPNLSGYAVALGAVLTAGIGGIGVLVWWRRQR
jgi:Tol biopolymer transport system component